MPVRNDNLSANLPAPHFEGAWDLVKLSISVFCKSFWFITKVTLPLYLPIETLKYILIPQAIDNAMASIKYDCYAEGIFAALMAPVLIFGITGYLRSKTFPSILSAYRFGLSRWGRTWVAYFITGFIIIFGLLLFVVPGILLCISYSLIAPILCFESGRSSDPIQRSHELTAGSRTLIFRASVILFLILMIVFLLCVVVTYIPIIFIGSKSLEYAWNVLSDCFADILFSTLTIPGLLLYLKLRRDKKKRPKEFWFLKWAR